MERLWRTVKYEEVYLHDYGSPREARQALSRHFDFYNYRRLHQALDYSTPGEVYSGSVGRPAPLEGQGWAQRTTLSSPSQDTKMNLKKSAMPVLTMGSTIMLAEFYGQHMGSTGDAWIVGPHQHLQLAGYLLAGPASYLRNELAHVSGAD